MRVGECRSNTHAPRRVLTYLPVAAPGTPSAALFTDLNAMGRTSGTRPKGSGPGWGGEAKGAGRGPAQPFAADSQTRETIPGGVGDPVKKLTREEKAAAESRRREAAWKAIDDLVADKMHPSHYLAARETLNRVDGMPVARNINLSVNDMAALSDADLDAEIARLAGAQGDAGAGAPGEAATELPE